ncbi:hypothetical protein [Kibdelosporangium aridum]|uniref:hypothetical protein n=1 Tax=Kibdelosporangium aridum TaxID=2030 RepID=UPI000AA5390A|nr:hypothetical protein [Kibdelosporangium aridum]
MDSLMHAFAAVLHGASFDGSGLAFGVVVLLVGGFGVVVLVDDDGLDVGVDAGDELLVVGGVVDLSVVVVVAGTFSWPAAATTGRSLGDEQALSTAAAATAAPRISLRTRIGFSSAR